MGKVPTADRAWLAVASTAQSEEHSTHLRGGGRMIKSSSLSLEFEANTKPYLKKKKKQFLDLRILNLSILSDSGSQFAMNTARITIGYGSAR